MTQTMLGAVLRAAEPALEAVVGGGDGAVQGEAEASHRPDESLPFLGGDELGEEGDRGCHLSLGLLRNGVGPAKGDEQATGGDGQLGGGLFGLVRHVLLGAAGHTGRRAPGRGQAVSRTSTS